MRFLRDLVILALAVCAVAAGLNHWRTNRQSIVSGIVLDMRTGRFVSGVNVVTKYLNSRGNSAETDSKGQFTLPVSHASEVVGLFVDHAQYAGLFGKTVGWGDHWIAPGDRENGLIVPAIPAAELSGTVHDDQFAPVAGCYVELLRPTDLRVLDLDSMGLGVRTDPSGRYAFRGVDPGVYYLLAECNGSALTEESKPDRLQLARQRRTAWTPVFYPNAQTLAHAQAVVAPPGEHLNALDIQVTKIRAFVLKGRFKWDHGQGPRSSDDFYSNDFSVRSVDLGSTYSVPCHWNIYPGTFECFPITVGRYQIAASVSHSPLNEIVGRPISPPINQRAVLGIQIANDAPVEIMLPMHQTASETRDNPPRPIRETGKLTIHLEGCGSYLYRRFSVQIWDHNPDHPPVSDISAGASPRFSLPVGRYRLSSFCGSYWRRYHDHYLDELINQKGGIEVDVLSGVNSTVDLRALGVGDVYHLASDYLRQDARPETDRARIAATASLP